MGLSWVDLGNPVGRQRERRAFQIAGRFTAVLLVAVWCKQDPLPRPKVLVKVCCTYSLSLGWGGG